MLVEFDAIALLRGGAGGEDGFDGDVLVIGDVVAAEAVGEEVGEGDLFLADEAALERAMACDARFRSREETQALLTMFDGTIFHRVTRQSSYEVRKAG